MESTEKQLWKIKFLVAHLTSELEDRLTTKELEQIQYKNFNYHQLRLSRTDASDVIDWMTMIKEAEINSPAFIHAKMFLLNFIKEKNKAIESESEVKYIPTEQPF